MGALALAWLARNTNTGSIILGVTTPDQLVQNLKAIDVLPKLTEEIFERIEKVLENKPAPLVSFAAPRCRDLLMVFVAYLFETAFG